MAQSTTHPFTPRSWSGEAAVTLTVDAADVVGPLPRPWRPMIGSEHLSFMLETDEVGGRLIGAELTEALRRMHDELHVETVRAHAILCDDLEVYREVDGVPVHDFSGVDRVYDALLATGLRPVVESVVHAARPRGRPHRRRRRRPREGGRRPRR